MNVPWCWAFNIVIDCLILIFLLQSISEEESELDGLHSYELIEFSSFISFLSVTIFTCLIFSCFFFYFSYFFTVNYRNVFNAYF